MKIFLQLGLIEILTDGAYYMTDIQLLIGQFSTKGERKKRERSRLQRQKLLLGGRTDICPPILEEGKDIEIDKGDFTPTVLGRYQNVFLSDQEQVELQTEFPAVWQKYVERLSEYRTSTGKIYQNHAATIHLWAEEDRRKDKSIPDYTYKKGESL